MRKLSNCKTLRFVRRKMPGGGNHESFQVTIRKVDGQWIVVKTESPVDERGNKDLSITV
jgi:hypothetical protein